MSAAQKEAQRRSKRALAALQPAEHLEARTIEPARMLKLLANEQRLTGLMPAE